jgi:hypothetical protein
LSFWITQKRKWKNGVEWNKTEITNYRPRTGVVR